MKNKGQALLEFVLILPILLLILFSIFDIGRLFSSKNELNAKCQDVAIMTVEGKDESFIKENFKDFDITLTKVADKVSISCEKKVEVLSPIVKVVMKDQFNLKEERVVIVNEE